MTKKLFPIGFGFAAVALAVLLVLPEISTVYAQQPPPPGQLLSPDQLNDLVAPIALYPDPLVSQILVAVTYPLEIVEANQWLLRNPNLTGAALTQAAEQQDWDPSVQALVAFPDILKYLTEDIAWTTNLGNVFLAQQMDVMDAIQRMRGSAARSGKLATTPQQQVVQVVDSGLTVYEILPVDPDIIFIPVYDPFWIWGAPRFYPYARWYYAPHPPVLYFNRGISIQVVLGSGWRGWNSWGWRPGWGSRSIVVNDTFIHRYNFNATHVPNLTGTTQWSHDVTHRQGVPYPGASLNARFRSNVRENLRSPNLPGQRGAASTIAPALAAPAGQRPGERAGERNLSPNTPGRDRGAFGGIENGDASRLHSDHGYSSLGPNRANPVNPAAPARGGAPVQSAPHPVQTPQRGRAPEPQAPHPAPQVHSAPAPAPRPAPAPAHQEPPKSGGGGGNSREGRR